MRRYSHTCLCLLLVVLSFSLRGAESDYVQVKSDAATGKVEIWVDGTLFTVYQYGADFTQKPSFYPVFSPKGTMINRELTFKRPDHSETKDHQHHQSLFLGYGDVDGADFWSSKNGETIRHRAILGMASGNVGQLGFLADWVTAGGDVALQERRQVTFGGMPDSRWMDHDITLYALSKPLTFNDTKEGMFALRLADALREDKGSGRYINAYGWETAEQIWGKRCPWVALRGKIQDEAVTVAIFEHPSTENHPSYWHARAYGLFSVNPFGRKDFVKGSEPINRRLPAYGSFHFRYRVAIYSGKVSKDRLDNDYWEYVK